MSYVERRLLPNERVLVRADLHWIILAGPALVTLIAVFFVGFTREWPPRSPGDAQLWLLSRAILVVAMPILIVRIVRWLTTECVLTNKRVVVKTGWLRRDVVEIPLSKIEGVQLHQPLIGRLLGYASIMVSGLGGTRELQRNIATPHAFHRALQEQLARRA